jgi:hypothetical protein
VAHVGRDDDHAIAVESEWQVREASEGAREQSGCDHEDERQRHLRDDEYAGETRVIS